MNSAEMKTKILMYYRFERRMLYCATEAGTFESDVLVSDGEKKIIEIEVKTSVADFNRDFKKQKHQIYSNPSPYHLSRIPTHFVFAIPAADTVLFGTATARLKDFPRYGILLIGGEGIVRKGRYVTIQKSPKPLTTQFCKSLHHQVICRSSSELVSLRMAGQDKIYSTA